MHKIKVFQTIGLTLLISLIAISCGGESSESTNVIIGQGGQVVIDTDAVKAAEDKQADASSGTETLSVEDVDVEELNTETEVVEEEDGIDVATADEDPLDNLLNTVAQFQGCLEDDGFEFIGAPGQLSPTEKPLTLVLSHPITLPHFRSALQPRTSLMPSRFLVKLRRT